MNKRKLLAINSRGFFLLCPLLVSGACHALPLEEIFVSAQHRTQSLIEVPLSLTVLDGEQLERWQVRNIEDLTAVSPGLSGWQQGLSTPIYALRGISSNSFGIGGEASVAVFVDEAYIGRINSTSVRMPDIERVEVLKGPQGTLLGRNAAAGAIHYHTRLPADTPSLDLRLAAGNYDLQEFGITGNTPLIDDRLQLRLTGFYREQSGDARNIEHDSFVGGEDGHGVRLALAYQQEAWTVNFSASSQALKSGGLGYETLDPELAAAGSVTPGPFDDRLATDINTYDRIESDDANLRVDWHPSDGWQLRSITAWHSNGSPNLFDVDGSAVFLTSAGFTRRDSETRSQEFRLSGNSGNLDWVGGVNYFTEDIGTTIELGYSDLTRLNGVIISPSDFGIPLPDFTLCEPFSDLVLGPCQSDVLETARQRGDYTSTGVYGDVSWRLNARLSISAGLRYSHDDKDFQYRSAAANSVTTSLNALRTAPLNPGGNILGYSTDSWESLSEQWDDWQPRFAINLLLSAYHSAYLNMARGYKAGGFEPAATPQLSVYDPETVSSLDLGVRGSSWHGRFDYNVAAFYYEHRDYQVQVIANGLARTINSGGVTGSGLEWELGSRLGQYWQLRFHGAYTDARFDELITDSGSAEDNRTILTPRHSIGLLIDYAGREKSWGRLGLGWQSDYQSDIYYTVQNTSDARRGDVQLHHLRFSYFAPGNKWQVDLMARNLFDKQYTIFQQDVGAGPVSRRGMPRQLIAQLSAHF